MHLGHSTWKGIDVYQFVGRKLHRDLPLNGAGVWHLPMRISLSRSELWLAEKLRLPRLILRMKSYSIPNSAPDKSLAC